MSKIDFTKTLASGLGAYNTNVGQWWVNKTRNAAHAAAYRNITNHVVQCAQRESGLIIDYGCGTGLLMKRLVDLLPAWKFLGIDGSKVMLGDAETWAGPKRKGRSASVEFRLAKLPDFSVSTQKADVIVFTFPNIVSVASGRRQFEEIFPNRSGPRVVVSPETGKGERSRGPLRFIVHEPGGFAESALSASEGWIVRSR